MGFGRCYLLSSTSRSDPPFSSPYSGLVYELINIPPRPAGRPPRGRRSFSGFCPANGMSHMSSNVFLSNTFLRTIYDYNFSGGPVLPNAQGVSLQPHQSFFLYTSNQIYPNTYWKSNCTASIKTTDREWGVRVCRASQQGREYDHARSKVKTERAYCQTLV